MKKAAKNVCAIGSVLLGFCTTLYAGMAVGIGYGLTTNKDKWPMVTTSAEAVKDFVETRNITRFLVHCGELGGKENAEKKNLTH